MKQTIALIILLLTSSVAFKTKAQDSLKTVTIAVSNLHCNNDMPTIKKQLQNQEGVEEISFTGIRGNQSVFTVSYHTSATSQEQIEMAIEATPGCDDKDSRPYKVKKAKTPKKKKI
jgi:copper chaperone CopZ